MVITKEKNINKPYKREEERMKKEPKGHHPPHPDLPPHILKELFDLKEKVGRLEGQIDVLLRIRK